MDRREDETPVARDWDRKGEAGHAPHQRGAAVATLAIDKRWAKDRPAEARFAQGVLAGQLGPGIVGIDIGPGADRGDQDRAPDPGVDRRRIERARHVDMDCVHPASAKNSSGVDDQVDTGEEGRPGGDCCGAGEIQFHEARGRKGIAEPCGIADDSHNLMSARG